jgi:uncharacterized protein
MKVLISGATGLVGNDLVQLLLKAGYHIHYLTTSRDKIKNKQNYTGFYWNPEKGEIDTNCLDGVDAIIHLAGASISKRWTKKYKQEIIDSRILSTGVLYNLLKNNPHTVHQFISASAIGIYPSNLSKVYNEGDTERDQSFLGTVVQKWEAAAEQVSELGIKVAKVRTGLVLSGKAGVLKELAGPVRFGIGSAFGSGRQVQSWIHADDLAGIYEYILREELEGVYNAVAPHPVTQDELVKTIAKVLGKPYFMPNLPHFLMNAILGEMSTLLFDSQNVSARKIVAAGYQFKYLSLEKAIEEELGE